MSKISSHRPKELKSMRDHDKFLKRIQKTLYYSKLPRTDRLSWPVTELASELFSEPRYGYSLDRLYCKDAAHITRETCVSPCSFVLALLYLERLKICDPEYLQSIAPSHLFLVSLMISSKFLHDSSEDDVSMNEWARSGGLSLEELIHLEKDFLNAIHWNIFVNEEAFWNKLQALEFVVAKREGQTRGYFTYTELYTLIKTFDIATLLNTVATVVAVLITSYTAGILTILGSMFIASHVPGHLLHEASTEVSDNMTSAILHESLHVPHNNSMNVVDVLQTSILLASIQSSQSNDNHLAPTYELNNHSNTEEVSWDWWNSPSMTWLSHASRLVETMKLFTAPKFSNEQFIEMTIAKTKLMDLVDQLHKGTTMRMQDQLEASWHTEWKDSLSNYWSYDHITHCFHKLYRSNC